MRQRTLFLTSTLLAASVALSAGTIDFNTLGGANGTAFTTYTENGYTIAPTAGAWTVAQNYGNPVPDVFCDNCATGTLEITGGQFTFLTVDFGEAQSTTFNYQLAGFFQGGLLLDTVGSVSSGTNDGNSFFTIANPTPNQVYDQLFISISTGGNDGNVDNIVLSSVPEPGSWAMIAGGLGVISLALKRRNRSR